MTIQSPHRPHESPTEPTRPELAVITWEPHLSHRQFRRRTLERATVTQVSMNGALVRARANTAIMPGTRISIGLGNDRGLVAVRRIEPSSHPAMSDYAVQFLWLDPRMQTQFDGAISTDAQFHFEWR